MAQLAVPMQRPSKLQSLPVIEQAKGVIMARNGLTADQAFDWLCRASKQENIKVRELAARITASATRHESSLYYPAPGRHEPPVDAEVVVLAAHRRRPQQD
jgi:hypothetical protein